MLRMILRLLKWTFYACLVLVLGQVIKWNGVSVSDQIKMGMAKAERSPWYGTAVKKGETLSKSVQKNLGIGNTSGDSDNLLDGDKAHLRELLKKLKSED